MTNLLYTAGGNATASLDVRNPGRITGMLVNQVGAAAGGYQVSFQSTSNFNQNDATGILATGEIAAGFTFHNYIAMNEAVDAGERIYLHTSGAGNETYIVIYIDEAANAPGRPSARRR